jgi:hypothetical protein
MAISQGENGEERLRGKTSEQWPSKCCALCPEQAQGLEDGLNGKVTTGAKDTRNRERGEGRLLSWVRDCMDVVKREKRM